MKTRRVENDDLAQLFSAAVEATDRRVQEARATRDAPEVDQEPEDIEEFEEELEFDFEIDSTSVDLPVDFLREQMAKTASPGAGADEAEGQAEQGPAVAIADTESEIEQLLSGSFGTLVSDDDPDLAFPDFDDDAGEDSEPPAAALAALGGSNESEAVAEAQREATALRRQLNEVSRNLSRRELELQTAEDRVATLEAQLVQAARQQASAGREFKTFRARAEREQEETRKFAAEKLLKELLEVLDNLERALEHSGDHRDSALGKGVAMTLEQFVDVLQRAGATQIEPAEGESFDPSFHEAVGQEQHETVTSGSVIRSLQKGLLLNGRLVRASMVVVSTGDGSSPPPKLAATGARASGDSEAEAQQASSAETPKKKTRKKRRRRKKPAAEAEAGAGAAPLEGEATAAPRKRKRRRRKRKVTTAEGAAPTAERSTETEEQN
ncbi:MAG: nucleotide exchange factor GrpE [Rickettsiales bacterium]|nr:nucleotide exchange factor GrpE [Rickettsiales bacterium]